MRAVVQRVLKAKVVVENQAIGIINCGLLVFLGVGNNDTETDLKFLTGKILNLRIFEDEEGKMNKSVLDIRGEVLVVSQFTLYGDCRKGRRPNFMDAASPEKGEVFYNKFVELIKESALSVATGQFGADMKIDLINDGPVTILLDSERVF